MTLKYYLKRKKIARRLKYINQLEAVLTHDEHSLTDHERDWIKKEIKFRYSIIASV